MEKFMKIFLLSLTISTSKSFQKCSDFSFSLPSDIPLDNLTTQIFDVIDHYKQSDPIGIPLPLPDPFDLPQIEKSILGFKIKMMNVKAFGISKFRVHNVSAEFDKKIEASCGLSFESLMLSGNYSMKPPFGSATEDFFTIKVSNLEVSGKVRLEVDKNGKLRAREIEADADVSKAEAEFINIPGIAGPVMNVLNSGNKTLFTLVKSNIIDEAKKMIKIQIDEQIEKNLGENFLIPNSISTVDFAISETRKFLKRCNDPFKIGDYKGHGMVTVNLYDTELEGLSTFHRVGDIKINLRDGKIYLNLNLGTQELKGKTKWEISMLKGVIKRKGKLHFSVEHLRILIELNQPLDLSKALVFDDLHLEMGNIQILSEGFGTIDYLMELLVNTIPNLLRFQLMDAIEKPLRQRLQEFADRINAEILIKVKLKELKEFGVMTMNFDRIEL